MGVHRLFEEGLVAHVGDVVVIGGDEAQHAARVKRVEVGERVQVLNGAGLVADGEVAEVRKGREGWEVAVRVLSARMVEVEKPRVEVWTAVPKGDRLEDMVDQLAQIGVAGWGPLSAERSVVEPREGKMTRVTRRAVEASKQSGRAWSMRVEDGGDLAAGLAAGLAGGLAAAANGVRVVMADASGGAYERSGAERIRVLVGPEGGWTEDEVRLAREAGAVVARFGAHVMRVETAAVTAAAVVLALEGIARGAGR